jgi:hypothetical protein
MSFVLGPGLTLGPGLSFTQPPPPPGAAGTITVGSVSDGFGGVRAGWDPIEASPPIGSTTGPDGGPAPLACLFSYTLFGSTRNDIRFVPGSYPGYTADSGGRVNGSSDPISVTVDAITATFTQVDAGSGQYLYRLSGSDVFGLQSKVGETLNVNLNL